MPVSRHPRATDPAEPWPGQTVGDEAWTGHKKRSWSTSLHAALVRHRMRRRHPPDRHDGRGGDGAAAADACGGRQLQSDEEPARTSRPRRHEIRAALAAVHRPDRDRLFAGPGGGGEGGRRVRQSRTTSCSIVGGSLGDQQLDAAGVKSLATLPSLDQLRAKLRRHAADPGDDGSPRCCRRPERSSPACSVPMRRRRAKRLDHSETTWKIPRSANNG